MKVPRLLRVVEIPLYTDRVNYWAALTFDNKILYSGDFQADYSDKEGRIFFNYDGKFASFDGRKIEVVADDKEAVDYVLYHDKPVPIYRKDNKFVLGNRKYSGFQKRYGFLLLQGDKELELLTPFAARSLEVPEDSLVLPTHVSLLYDDHVIVVDVLGNVMKVKSHAHFIGSYGEYRVFYSRSGRVLIANGSETTIAETFCDTSPFVVGLTTNGIVILCDDKVKVMTPNGWLVKSSTFSPLRFASYSNTELKVENGDLRVVNDGDPDTQIAIRNVKSVVMLGEYPYVVHSKYVERLSYVICEAPVTLTKRVIDGRPAELMLDECFEGGEVYVEEPLVVLAKEGRKIELDTKLLIDRIKARARVVLGDVEAVFPIEVKVLPPRVRMKAVELRSAKGGRLISSSDFNAILTLKVDYELPSKLNYDLVVECCGSKSVVKVRGKGEKTVTLQVRVPNEGSVVVRGTLGNEYKADQINVETLANVIPITPEGGRIERLEYLDGAAFYKVERVIKDEFAWERVWVTPTSYYGVRFVKKGLKLSVGGTQVEVTSPVEVKDSDGKSVLLVPVDDPVTRVDAYLMGNNISLHVECASPAVIEAFYAGRVARSLNCGDIVLPLDPFYREVVLNVYHNGLTWSHKLELGFNVSDAFRYGWSVANALAKEIKTYGLP